VRRRLILGLKILVSLGLVGYVVWSISQREGLEVLGARLGRLELGFVALAMALHFVAVGTGVLRYRLLLARRGISLRLGWLTRTYLVGRFVGAFTPSTVGLDLYRSIAVARKTGRRVESAAAILAEKLFGLLGLSIVTLALVCLGASGLLGPSALPMAVVILAGASIGLYALNQPIAMKRLTRILPPKIAARVDPMLDAIAQGGRSTLDTLRILGLAITSHLATATVFVATALALGLTVDVATLLVVGNAIVIATLIPISIGGVGVREGVAVVLLASAAVGPTDASLVALLGYLTGQVPALLGGALQVSHAAEESQAIETAAPLPSI